MIGWALKLLITDFYCQTETFIIVPCIVLATKLSRSVPQYGEGSDGDESCNCNIKNYTSDSYYSSTVQSLLTLF